MFTSVDKAIAAGLVSAIGAWLAHYGITLSPAVHDTVSSIALLVISYLVAHIVVFFAKNKVK